MKILRWVGWVAGVVIIGMLGSGLWQVVFHGLYESSSRALLTFVTLGLESTRNNIYAQVAHGHHELPSLLILAGMALVPLCFLPPVVSGFWLARWFRPETREAYQRQLARVYRTLTILCTIAVFAGIVLFAQVMMIVYANKAITHFEHSLTICAPYLTSDEEQVIRSQFALIKTSADYAAIMHRLQAVAAQHQLTLREFTIW